MDRMEMAKKLFSQAQKMTLGMAASVVAYGAIGYYLVQIGKAGPAVLNAQTYPMAKYGGLAVSLAGVFGMWLLSRRMFPISPVQPSTVVRSPQKIFLRTLIMNAGAELPLLLGMLLVFFGRQPYDYIPFAMISLTGFALAFPKKQQWVDWLGSDF